jgi:hypothetical protein
VHNIETGVGHLHMASEILSLPWTRSSIFQYLNAFATALNYHFLLHIDTYMPLTTMHLNFEETILCILLTNYKNWDKDIHTYHGIMQIYNFCHITSSSMCVITVSTILHKMALNFWNISITWCELSSEFNMIMWPIPQIKAESIHNYCKAAVKGIKDITYKILWLE